MIETIQGNILDIKEGFIVHGTNCKGVMGKGLALQIKQRYPEAYSIYHREYLNNNLFLGDISVANIEPKKWIINANTQLNYGYGKEVSYHAIEECFIKVNKLATFINTQNSLNIPVCFPKIGAGLGGGDWDIIKDIIDRTLSDNLIKRLYVL